MFITGGDTDVDGVGMFVGGMMLLVLMIPPPLLPVGRPVVPADVAAATTPADIPEFAFAGEVFDDGFVDFVGVDGVREEDLFCCCCWSCCRHLARRFLNHTCTLDSGRLIFRATSSRMKMSG